MNTFISAVLTLGTLVPLMWFNIVDGKFLPVDEEGKLLDYCVVRQDAQGVDQTLCYNKAHQTAVFNMSKAYPKPL